MAKDIFEVYAEGNFGSLVEFARENPESVHACNESGQTLLHLAVQNGESDLVKYLIHEGSARVNTEMVPGTPMTLALQRGHVEIVKFLKEKYYYDIVEVLQHAVSYGSKPQVMDYLWDQYKIAYPNSTLTARDLLLKEDYDNRHADSKLRKTQLLLWAASAGLCDLVKELIGLGADKNARDGNGLNALHLAIENQHTEIVKLLYDEDLRRSGYNKLLRSSLVMGSIAFAVAKFRGFSLTLAVITGAVVAICIEAFRKVRHVQADLKLFATKASGIIDEKRGRIISEGKANVEQEPKIEDPEVVRDRKKRLKRLNRYLEQGEEIEDSLWAYIRCCGRPMTCVWFTEEGYYTQVGRAFRQDQHKKDIVAAQEYLKDHPSPSKPQT